MDQTLISNETHVKLEELENGTKQVHINTPDADVYVNGVLVWQKFDNPAYAKVPPVLRAYVHDHQEFLEEKDGKLITDLYTLGYRTSVTLYIEANLRNPIHARFDYISSLEELERDYLRNHVNIDDATANKLIKEFTELHKSIELAVTEAGWRLVFSHSMSDHCGGWWDVIFKLETWNEEKFNAIWKLFSDFNIRLREVFDQYNI